MTTNPAVSRASGHRGQVAGIEALPFGLLVLIGGALLVTNLWAVVDTKFAADSAARESARYVAENAGSADDHAVRAGADRVARDTMQDHRRSAPIDVEVTGEALERCARISVTVRTSVAAVRVPFLGALGPSFEIAATHSELVDPTRSGVPGEATCLG